MGKDNEQKDLALTSRMKRPSRARSYAPFTSPSVLQLVCHNDEYGNQHTRRYTASLRQDSDTLSLRRSKRLKVSSIRNVSLDSTHHLHPFAVPKVTPSPRIMQVAAPQQVVVSPIAKVISSTRRRALVQAAKSHGDFISKKNTIVARNTIGKLPITSNEVRNASFPLQGVPQGIPNIFSTSTPIFDSYQDSHFSNLECDRGYWFTYGFEYYQFLSLSEAKKLQETVDYGPLTQSNVCTRSMSKKIHETGEDQRLGMLTDFYKTQSFLPTTDAHCYMDTSDEHKGMLWDCSFPNHHEISPSMRTVLIHWLLEVGQCYSLVPETIHLTAKLIDRVLSIGLTSFSCPYEPSKAHKQEKWEADEALSRHKSRWEVSKAKLQCVGSACMFIASKIEEVNPPSASDFALISGSTYAAKDILSMELQICLTLKFDLHFVTPIPFMEKYLVAECHQETNTDERGQLKGFALYLLEMSLLEHSFTAYPSSMVAASALYLAKVLYFNATCQLAMSAVPDEKRVVGQTIRQYWDDTLTFYTGYTKFDLKETIQRLIVVHNKVQDSPIHRAVFLRHQQQGWITNSFSKVNLHDLGDFPAKAI